jgi:hypothetical protein
VFILPQVPPAILPQVPTQVGPAAAFMGDESAGGASAEVSGGCCGATAAAASAGRPGHESGWCSPGRSSATSCTSCPTQRRPSGQGWRRGTGSAGRVPLGESAGSSGSGLDSANAPARRASRALHSGLRACYESQGDALRQPTSRLGLHRASLEGIMVVYRAPVAGA